MDAVEGQRCENAIYLYDSNDPSNGLTPSYGNANNIGSYADQGDEDPLGPDPTTIVRSSAYVEPGETLFVGIDIEELGVQNKDIGVQINAVSDSTDAKGSTYDAT